MSGRNDIWYAAFTFAVVAEVLGLFANGALRLALLISWYLDNDRYRRRGATAGGSLHQTKESMECDRTIQCTASPKAHHHLSTECSHSIGG
jgi:hypothetical protein